MAKQKLNQQQLDGVVMAKGFVNGPTANSVKSLTQELNVGLTYNGTDTYTVPVKGIYYIHVQQLTSNGAATYLHIQINGGTVRYGHLPTGRFNDQDTSELRELNAGDTIRFYHEYASTTVWGNQHSGYQIMLIKRTD